MINIAKLFFCLLIFIVGTPASAGTQSGIVATLISRNSDGLLYFFLTSAPATGRPSCATFNYWIIKDENSNSGKRLLAMLLVAKTTGQAITVNGAGTCTRWPDGEDVDSIVF